MCLAAGALLHAYHLPELQCGLMLTAHHKAGRQGAGRQTRHPLLPLCLLPHHHPSLHSLLLAGRGRLRRLGTGTLSATRRTDAPPLHGKRAGGEGQHGTGTLGRQGRGRQLGGWRQGEAGWPGAGSGQGAGWPASPVSLSHSSAPALLSALTLTALSPLPPSSPSCHACLPALPASRLGFSCSPACCD